MRTVINDLLHVITQLTDITALLMCIADDFQEGFDDKRKCPKEVKTYDQKPD